MYSVKKSFSNWYSHSLLDSALNPWKLTLVTINYLPKGNQTNVLLHHQISLSLKVPYHPKQLERRIKNQKNNSMHKTQSQIRFVVRNKAFFEPEFYSNK